MKIGILTLFPEAFSYFESESHSGLMAKALKNSALYLEDLRQHGEGKHKTVDDSPYGGGDGMLLKANVLEAAYLSLLEKMELKKEEARTVFLSPSGSIWTQNKVEHYHHSHKNIVLVCGRYAGVDQRFIEEHVDEEISLGPFILNGGELAAMAVVESLLRLQLGALGNALSSKEDSFSGIGESLEPGAFIEAPSYTRPSEWKGRKVPEVLSSGNHQKIKDFRRQESLRRSREWLEHFEQDLAVFKKKDD